MVASLGLVVSLIQSVTDIIMKLKNEHCKRKYKWIKKGIIVNYNKQFIHYAEIDPILS